MKAIVCTNESISSPLPGIRLVADSAIGRQIEPYWLDSDSGIELCALMCPCYRIGRLGKNIDRKFAHRYIDGLTACALILPVANAARPLETAEIFFASTSALIPGDDCAGLLPEGEILIEADGQSAALNTDFAIEAVSRLSAYMTLKTGDRIIDCSRPLIQRLGSRMIAQAKINGADVLKFKVL